QPVPEILAIDLAEALLESLGASCQGEWCGHRHGTCHVGTRGALGQPFQQDTGSQLIAGEKEAPAWMKAAQRCVHFLQILAATGMIGSGQTIDLSTAGPEIHGNTVEAKPVQVPLE